MGWCSNLSVNSLLLPLYPRLPHLLTPVTLCLWNVNQFKFKPKLNNCWGKPAAKILLKQIAPIQCFALKTFDKYALNQQTF